MAMHEIWELQQMQAMSLEEKIRETQARIRIWHDAWKKYTIVDKATGKTRTIVYDSSDPMDEPPLKDTEYIDDIQGGQVYVSFSGGKDSTVLLDIARKMYPDIKAMFVDIPTQYRALREFVNTYKNVDVVRPKISFVEVCKKYGFPLISKEVSESVYGARKYLISILEQNDNLAKQAPYSQFYRKLTGQGEYSKGDYP